MDKYTRNIVDEFMNKLFVIEKENISSVCLYGRVLAADYVPKKSNINILIILKKIDYRFIKNVSSIVKKYERKKLVPLFLTERHMSTSSDVFPIEFLDMQDNYSLVYGADILKNIEIKSENLRLECEEKIKGHILILYQVLMENVNNNRKIKDVLKKSMLDLFLFLQGLIRLKNKKPEVEKYSLLKQFVELFNVGEFLLIMYGYIDENKKISDEDLQKYIETLQEIAKLSDELEV